MGNCAQPWPEKCISSRLPHAQDLGSALYTKNQPLCHISMRNRSTIGPMHVMQATFGRLCADEERGTEMRSKIGLVLGILAFLAVFLLMRYYEFDLPVWNYFFGYRPDPLSLHLSGEFVESNLGLTQETDGSLTARLVAQQFLFVPQCIEVPVGVAIRFRVTSADVVHVLFFAGTTYRIRAAPGYVSESRLQFPHVGTFSIPCHEFCGGGHYAMRSRVLAVPKEQFHPPQSGERSACAPH